MSSPGDPPQHSSNSDAELDTSDKSSDSEEVAENEKHSDADDNSENELDREFARIISDDNSENELDREFARIIRRAKRRKVESQGLINPQSSSLQGEPVQVLGSSPKEDICPPHPGDYAGMCLKCGKMLDDASGVPLGYIDKNLRLGNAEMTRVCYKDLKSLFSQKKLYLVLELDHTLLNSAWLVNITAEEGYLYFQRDLPDTLKTSLFRLDELRTMTKLRPFVHTFLKEASNLFEMFLYTMAERPYALQMAKLLDPEEIYFNSKVIAQSDCTQGRQKGLDVVMGHEGAVLILDDTESVWGKQEDNLILMERYLFFASSCKQFGCNRKSLAELKTDEIETEGALMTVLKILKRIHSLFFHEDNLEDRDVRQILKSVRKEILKDCKIVFPRVLLTNSQCLWKMAEQMGATCSTKLDSFVTHVVSMDLGTRKSRWAVRKKKFLVNPRWIKASLYMCQKQPEENFPVS